MVKMKKSWLAIGSILAAACVPAAISAEAGSFYLRTAVGVAIVEDIEEEALGFGDTFTLSLTPGVRVDIAPGYNVNEYLAIEFNTGGIWNGLDEIEGPGGSVDVKGDALQVPLLLNVIGRFPIEDTGLVPFVGGGGGGVYQYINIDEAGGMDVEDDAEDDLHPAFQVFGGLMYQAADNWSVGLVYKYLYVFSGETYTDPGFGDIDRDDTRTHSISAIFSFDY